MYKRIITFLSAIIIFFASIQITSGNTNEEKAMAARSEVVSSEYKIQAKPFTSGNNRTGNTEQVISYKVTSSDLKPASAKASTTNNKAAVQKTPVVPAATVTLGKADIDTKNLGKGLVGVSYNHSSGEKIKVIISKGGNKYTYNLNSLNGFEYFPLQMGNGTYSIGIYKNVSGTSYKAIKTYNADLNLSNSNIVYLNSIQNIKWTSSTNTVAKAKSLASGKASTEAKVEAIYNYVVKNIKYDKSRLNNLGYSYIPNISNTYSTKKGICYDFASTFAAMLRGMSVPTKLVMGNSSNVNGYHAWNEVLLNGKWVIIDTGFDSQLNQAGKSYTMIKSSSSYSKSKEY